MSRPLPASVPYPERSDGISVARGVVVEAEAVDDESLDADLVETADSDALASSDLDEPLEAPLVAETRAEPASPGNRSPADAVASTWPRSLPMRCWYGLTWGLEWLFGLVSVVGTLAVLAAIPIVNFVSLGYLLEASGRVARSGRLRDGLVDVPRFARIGSLVAGTWLWAWVPRLFSSLAIDAYLIDPGSPAARGWRVAQLIVTSLVVGHILLAWYSGGRLRHFFWPLLAPFQLSAKVLFAGIVWPIARPMIVAISPRLAQDLDVSRPLSDWFPPAILWAGMRRGHMYAEARDAVWDFVVELKLLHYFWLGIRGFAGALAWLLVPSLLLMAGTSGEGPGTILLGFIGAFGLTFVLLYLPFLQTRFAAENRFAAMFEWREIRRLFRRAPIAWWLALTITLAFALPLFLLKIEPLPRELVWTTTLVFIVFIYPARLLAGWAMSRALKRPAPRHFVFRWMARLAAIPVILFYLLILFFTQYTSFLGPASLLEQHAFLLPVPFVGL